MPGLSDPNWWPTPVRRPPQTLDNLFLNGWLAPVVVGVAVVAAVLVLSGHHSATPAHHAATQAAAPVALSEQERAAAQRKAMDDCIRHLGVTASFGRLSRPSAQKLRTAVTLCRSMLQAPPSAPAKPATAPVA